MNAAKIRLSAKEMELVVNADWILTKNRVMEKAKWLLEELQTKMMEYTRQYGETVQPIINKVPPKISKGENYKGLPYLILDYPRIFEKENTFAVRNMFWWGNFFSTTLHLSGGYKKNAEEIIIASFDLLKENGFCYCINDDEWEHHFDDTNYVSLQSISFDEFQKLLNAKSFIKIAKHNPLHQWDKVVEVLLNDFKLLTGIISYPSGEKDL